MATVTPIKYTGLIFCPTVSTGAFVARRNGKVFVTGNSGFPKSLDVAKAIQGKLKTGNSRYSGNRMETTDKAQSLPGSQMQEASSLTMADGGQAWSGKTVAVDDPAALQWQGFGTAIKPAHEPIILARKPLIGTVVENVLAHGTGALNIDGCRISGPASVGGSSRNTALGVMNDDAWQPKTQGIDRSMAAGRWPANFILSHSDGCELRGTKAIKSHNPDNKEHEIGASGTYGSSRSRGNVSGHAVDGKETVEDWACVDSCPIRMLDEQSGVLTSGKAASGGHKRKNSLGSMQGTALGGSVDGSLRSNECAGSLHGDTGGASRFFYTAKASKGEKYGALTCGCAVDQKVSDIQVVPLKESGTTQHPPCGTCGQPMTVTAHPTVKPIALMRYLCRLVTPPGGVVLDPFMGSGTTGRAAIDEGFRFIGIEREEAYHAIAKSRIGTAQLIEDECRQGLLFTEEVRRDRK